MNADTVTIFLANPEAVKWKLFQRHFDPFTVMLDAGIFSIRNGSASLHFDSEGTLQKIERADTLYSRKHVIPN